MKTIPASKLKAQGLAVLDDLEPEGVIVTRNGKPVAKLIPWPRPSSGLIGALKNQIRIHGDILTTGVPWDAES
jgi:antitoxin (DNA-binding transcriptional repressor) of toxin-antitoxin stability system